MGQEGRGSLMGRTLGGYQLVRLLGAGGMAEVYLARDMALDRDVAVKVLLAELKQDKEFEDRFRAEARRVANLNHPHIIKIYAAGVSEDGMPYMVMPVEPRSLRHRLDQRPIIAPAEAVRLTQEVASALDMAHLEGLVHRDVKPENILLDARDGALLTDFGIARMLSSRGPDHRPSLITMSTSGLPVGTPEYMAPEQLRGEPLDQRVDIYALGAILYEMLTGQLPRTGETPYQIAAQTLTAPLVPPSQHNPRIWPELEAVVMRAMADDREARYPTAGKLAIALDDAMRAQRPDWHKTIVLGDDVTAVPTAPPLSGPLTSHALTYGAPNAWTATPASGQLWRNGQAHGKRKVKGASGARTDWRRWWWVAALAVLLLGIGGVSLSGLLSQSARPTTPTTTSVATKTSGTPKANATQTSAVASARATATSAAKATVIARSAAATKTASAQPTATTPPPTATPTPALALSSSYLPMHYVKGGCQGTVTISNVSAHTVGWQSAGSRAMPASWQFALTRTPASAGTPSPLPPGTMPKDSAQPASSQDTVTLTATKYGGCVFSPYQVTVTDTQGHTYSFQILQVGSATPTP